MSASPYTLSGHLASPMINAVVIYDNSNDRGGNEVMYETGFMDSEIFFNVYPRSIYSHDRTSELDSLLYGLDEQYRDPEMVRIVFYKLVNGVVTRYEYDPRLVNEDDEA